MYYTLSAAEEGDDWFDYTTAYIADGDALAAAGITYTLTNDSNVLDTDSKIVNIGVKYFHIPICKFEYIDLNQIQIEYIYGILENFCFLKQLNID